MPRKPRGKLKPELYDEIREYARTHTIHQTAKQYDLGESTISFIKRYDDFRQMKQARAEQQRNYNRRVNNISPSDYKIGDIAPETKKEIGSPFESGAEPKTVIPTSLKKVSNEQDGDPVTTKINNYYNGKTAHEWFMQYSAMKHAYDQTREKVTQLENCDWKKQYDIVCADRQKIWDELQALKKAAGGNGDPSNTIVVTVGETRVEIPINIKQ